MPDQCLFRYDGCLSGRCVCRTLTGAILAQRLTSDAANGEYERRRVAELTDEAMRLFASECRTLTPHASADGHAQICGVFVAGNGENGAGRERDRCLCCGGASHAVQRVMASVASAAAPRFEVGGRQSYQEGQHDG